MQCIIDDYPWHHYFIGLPSWKKRFRTLNIFAEHLFGSLPIWGDWKRLAKQLDIPEWGSHTMCLHKCGALIFFSKHPSQFTGTRNVLIHEESKPLCWSQGIQIVFFWGGLVIGAMILGRGPRRLFHWHFPWAARFAKRKSANIRKPWKKGRGLGCQRWCGRTSASGKIDDWNVTMVHSPKLPCSSPLRGSNTSSVQIHMSYKGDVQVFTFTYLAI